MAVFDLVYQEYEPFVCTIGESLRIPRWSRSNHERVLGTMPSPFEALASLKVGCQMETDRMYLCEVFEETCATVSLVQVRRPVKPLIELVITSSLCSKKKSCNC